MFFSFLFVLWFEFWLVFLFVFYKQLNCKRWGLWETEEKLTWSIFQHKIVVTVLANENLYTYVKETDILLCLNMSPFFCCCYFVVRLSRKNYGTLHKKIKITRNLKQSSPVSCANDCLESRHLKTPFYFVRES